MSASIALFNEQLWAHAKSGEPLIALGIHVDDENLPQMLVVNSDGGMSWLNLDELTIDWRYSASRSKWVDVEDADEPPQIPAKAPARRSRKA